MSLPVWIEALGCALPGPPIATDRLLAWLEGRLAPGSALERLRLFAARCGVEARHSVMDFAGGEADRIYPAGAVAADARVRSRLFAERAAPLAAAACREALPEGVAGITHLVVATCTGAVAPGIDLQLLDLLGLPPHTRRCQVGFMGCYAAMPALRVAADHCRADPAARVLVVCCELGSLHLHAGPDDDALLGACLFGDGAAAAVVRSGEGPVGLGLRFIADEVMVVPGTARQMAWEAGPQGFRLHLDPRVTRSLSLDIESLADRLLGGRARKDVHWCVHPGGPRILDEFETRLGLAAGANDAGREALRRAGNRSSATVLHMLRDGCAAGWRGPVACFAFGPGLTAEALLLAREA